MDSLADKERELWENWVKDNEEVCCNGRDTVLLHKGFQAGFTAAVKEVLRVLEPFKVE